MAGLALGVVGMINQLAKRLSDFKKRCEEFGSLPDNWDSSIKSFQDCKTSVKCIEETLENDNESLGDRAISTFRDILKQVEKSLKTAEIVLEKLEDEFTRENSPASASGSSHVVGNSSKQGRRSLRSRNRIVDGRLVNEIMLFSRVNKVKSEVEKLDSIWKETQLAMNLVVIALVTPSMRVNDKESCDEYVAHFDKPPLSNKVVLNFSGNTMEACLKRGVLSNSASERVTVAVSPSVLGAVGMGGIGKTVALQGLCRDSEVKDKYFDGVFFITLGQDAVEEDVIESVALFVESSGGESRARDITNKRSAESAAKQASLWFKGRCVLFVCDDIWSFEGHPIGYLSSLKLLLCNSPSSAMVISTREKSISQQFVEVKFMPREVRGQQAWSILAKYGGIEIESVEESSDTLTAFGDILDVCGGLPVALGVAGTSVRNLIEENSGIIGQSVVTYAHELKENIESVGDGSVDDYRGLRAVVKTSLKHCEDWAGGDEGRRKLGCELSVREKFEALSILRKQAWIPRTCLQHLWGTNERATKQVMSKLSDMHLVSRRWQGTPVGKVDGLALHDLMLEQAQTLSIENNRGSVWHARLLDGYMRKAVGNVVQSNTVGCREWWDCEKVPEDGYIEKNVARHLGLSEGCELESLLCDVRWSERRMKVGGIVALREDFQELSHGSGGGIGADAVCRALEESWVNINNSIHATPFEMYGRLQSQSPSSEFVQRFLSSVSMHVPKPHFVPKHELRWRADGRQLFRIEFEKAVGAVCLSEEQNVIAVGQGDEIHVFDLQTMCIVHRLKGHDGEITSVAMSGDGSRIFSGSRDGTVRVWDGESGECVVGPLHGHERDVSCVAMSGDGSRIVSGSWDETVRVWDGESGECVVGPLHGHEDGVWCVAMSGDGSRIVSGSHDGTVRVWDGESGECVVGPLRGHESVVWCVAMSGDGSRIVSGSDDGTVRVWNGESGECVVGPLRGHEDRVLCVAMSEDGSRIVSGSCGWTVRVWDGESGECVVGPLRGHENGVSCVAMSGDGSRIFSGSWDRTVRVWDGESGECVVGPLRGHEDTVMCVAMSGDGSRIFSGSRDGTVRVWDGESGECVLGPLHGHEDDVWCVAMSGDGSRIVSGSRDRTVRVWNGESGECVVGPLRGHERAVTCVAMSGDGSRIFSGCYDGTVRVWDGESGECVLGPLHGHEGSVRCVAMSGDGSRIVSGSHDGTVRVWDGESGECVVGPLRGHERDVTCVAMSGDGSRIVSGSLDGTVRVWDGESGEFVEDGQCVQDGITGQGKYGAVHYEGHIRRLEFDGGSELCVVYTSREVFLLDTSTGTRMHRPGYMIQGWNRRIYASGENAKTVQVATMPFECTKFCYNKLQSKAVAVLRDGQVVIGELLL